VYSYIPVRERHMRRVEQNLTEAELMEIVLCIIVRRLDMTGRALISPITLTRKHNGRNGRPGFHGFDGGGLRGRAPGAISVEIPGNWRAAGMESHGGFGVIGLSCIIDVTCRWLPLRCRCHSEARLRYAAPAPTGSTAPRGPNRPSSNATSWAWTRSRS